MLRCSSASITNRPCSARKGGWLGAPLLFVAALPEVGQTRRGPFSFDRDPIDLVGA